MTKLELINEEIELVKDYLKNRKKYNLKSKRYTPERLELLQQIKNDLETWETTKKHLILDKEFHRIDLHLYHDTKDKEDYLKLKKELEVK